MGELKVLGQGNFVRLVNVDSWEYVERLHSRGVAVMIPVTDDGKLVLVEQYRPAVSARVVELPAGLVGDIPGEANESTEAAAQRELIEETGYEAGEIKWLLCGPPAPGLCRETLNFYLCTQLVKRSAGGGDETEDITVHEVPLGEVESWLHARVKADGVLIDPKIFAGLYFANSG